MDVFDFTVVVIVLFLTSFYIKEQFVEVEYVRSNIDNREYLVQNAKKNQQVADMLATINQKLKKLVDILNTNPKYKDDPKSIRLKKKYKPGIISESSENEKYTSYSVDKKKIIFCLRARDKSGNLTDINTLTYVAIHELAHLATVEVGHTEKFWKNFKWLLQIAEKNGIYNYVDYSSSPQPYCGIVISSNILDRKH
jgi:predicted metal-dependent hydrolase